MGGRGNGAVRNSSSKPIKEQINEFAEELNNREYGKGKGLVSEKRQQEFRRTEAEITNYLKDRPGDDLVIPASGFAGANGFDTYVHTTAKLNDYQKILRSRARNIRVDLSLGVIDEDRARQELRVLKALDATIKDRRKKL